MKKLLSTIIVLTLFATLVPVVPAYAAGQKQMILVTAYYSPLPNQSVYIRGNYQADVRLNGRGTNGADGTEVFEGMLAAPKTYPFGTRIKIPGLGVGEVHDRGGAIIARKNYDRIDVWMGRGEEGLARALNWGARLVEGTVYFNANQAEPGLSFAAIDKTMPAKLRNRKMQNPRVFTKNITKSSPKTNVKDLQEALFSLGYYDGPINGVYDSFTTDAVRMFQLNEGVISNKLASGSGNFGPMTRAKLKSVLESYNRALAKEIDRLEQNRTLLASGLGKSSSGEDVRRLQQMLWELGYYTGDLSGQYDSATIDAVFEFQKDNNLIDSEWDKGAGFFGKMTHKALVSAVNKRIVKMVELPMEKQVWVPAKKTLPKIAELAPVQVSESRSLIFDAKYLNTKVVQDIQPVLLKNLDLYDQNPEVVKLQNKLIQLGYMSSGKNTGYFGKETKTALIKFQLDKNIISDKSSTGAGRLGPKTRRLLNSI